MDEAVNAASINATRIDALARDDVRLLVEVLKDLSTKKDPEEAVASFARRFREIRPVDAFMSVSVRGLENGRYKITRFFNPERVSGTPDGSLPNPWRDWDRLETHDGGFLGEVLARGVPQLYHDLDVAGDPVIGELLPGSWCCSAIPVFDNGEPINWGIRFLKDPKGYDLGDLEQDLLTTNLFGGITRNLVSLQMAEDANARLAASLEQIAGIQRALLPQATPRTEHLRISTSYLTSDEAGGDYYDYFPLACGSLGILIADVSGHGPAAATVMAMLRAILHCYEAEDRSPDRFMQYANDRLLRSRLDGSFVTAFFAVYDPSRGTLTYSRCGHNAPRLYRAKTGQIESLDSDGTAPLGILDDIEARSAAVRLEPGDTVLLYTDGITEAFDPDRREMFGVERMDAALAKAQGDPDTVVERIHADLYKFTRSRRRDDDQTLVVLRYAPDG